MCGVLLGEPVEVGPRGTITTFCVVNVPFLGQQITPPYVAATILLDGADLGVQHLIQECAADDVRMGMRVQAVWDENLRPDARCLKWFEPNGEPDASYESYRDYL